MAKGDEPNATRLLEALGDQPLHIGEVSLKAPTQWLGHQVEKQLQRQLEEQRKQQLVEQQREAEEVIIETERQPVSADQPEADVPQVAAIPLQPFATTTCSLRKKTGSWQDLLGKNHWMAESRPLQVDGFLEHLQQESVGQAVFLTMVKIPAGAFLMGSPMDEPEHLEVEGPLREVELDSFFMGQTPVTQAQWREVAGWRERPGERWGRQLETDPSRFQSKDGQSEYELRLFKDESNTDNRPVENVSWLDAIEFCRRLSQRTGRNYTLPSEAQWEYACRAGTTMPFHFGDTISPELANYDGNYVYIDGPKGIYRQQTTPVGYFPANDWGLQDMHGNVWEWCLDEWHDSYRRASDDGRTWLDFVEGQNIIQSQKNRLLRGGSWNAPPAVCRSVCRNYSFPDVRGDVIGFRVCCLPQD